MNISGRRKQGRERRKEGRERKKMKEREYGGEREEEIEGGGKEGWNVDRDTFQNEQRERARVREMDS